MTEQQPTPALSLALSYPHLRNPDGPLGLLRGLSIIDSGTLSLLDQLAKCSLHTLTHSVDVADLSIRMASLLGLDPKSTQILVIGGTLHDIGKLTVPNLVNLNRPLNASEREQMREHVYWGDHILETERFPPSVREIALLHHEYYNGNGYPKGLRGESIPLLARLVQVADAASAMRNHRPYRSAVPVETVLKEIRDGLGTQFDPIIGNLFLEHWRETVD